MITPAPYITVVFLLSGFGQTSTLATCAVGYVSSDSGIIISME